MSDKITTFVESLSLSSLQAQKLQEWLQGDSDTAAIFSSQNITKSASIKIAFLLLSSFFQLLIVNDPEGVSALDAHW